VVIDVSKDRATLRHEGDSLALERRIYTDGSCINERTAAAAAVAPGYQTTITLGHSGDAQVYHAELAGIAQALQAEASSTTADSSTVIYSDSQAA